MHAMWTLLELVLALVLSGKLGASAYWCAFPSSPRSIAVPSSGARLPWHTNRLGVGSNADSLSPRQSCTDTDSSSSGNHNRNSRGIHRFSRLFSVNLFPRMSQSFSDGITDTTASNGQVGVRGRSINRPCEWSEIQNCRRSSITLAATSSSTANESGGSETVASTSAPEVSVTTTTAVDHGRSSYNTKTYYKKSDIKESPSSPRSFDSSSSNNNRNSRNGNDSGSIADGGDNTDSNQTAKDINSQLLGFFSVRMDKQQQGRLKYFIKSNVECMNQVNMVTLLHRCSKNKVSIFDLMDVDTIVALLRGDGVISSHGIATAIYGLHNYDDQDGFSDSSNYRTSGGKGRKASQNLVKPVITALTDLLISCNETLDGRALSHILYGMKSFSWQTSESLDLLNAVILKIELAAKRGEYARLDYHYHDTHTNSFDIRSNNNINSNNNRNNNDNSKMRIKISPTSIKQSNVETVYIPMNSRLIGNACIGLQNLPGDNTVKAKILSFLANSIAGLNHNVLDSFSIAGVLLGIKSSRSENNEVRKLLGAINFHLDAQLDVGTKGDVLKIPESFRQVQPQHLSTILYCLQSCSTLYIEVVDFIQHINRVLSYERAQGSNSENTGGLIFTSGEQVGRMLGGIKRFSSDSTEVLALLDHLANILFRSFQMDSTLNVDHTNSISMRESASSTSRWYKTMSGLNIAGCLYGLQSMSDKHEQVRLLLAVLAKGIHQSKEAKLSGRALANALYGLRGMSHNSDEVRAILTVLLRKVDHLASDYTAQHIAMQLYGLQNMNTSIPQVGGMLGIIGEKLTPIPSQSISAESFCNSVYGLKSMSAESLRVRSIVGSLGIKLFDIMNNKRDNSDFPITGQQVGMCMTGLRNMGSEWLEVQCMLGALAMTLSSADIELDPVTICTCLYSLRRMGGGRALPQRDSTAATEVNSVSSISSSLMNWNSGDGSIAERRRFRLPAELVDFLDVLESKMSLRTAPLSGSMIATALYGLQGLTADTTAVRRILRHLTTDLLLAYNSSSYQGDMINPVLPLGSQGIANLFFGLQNMSSSHLVVRKMLSAVSVACNASRDFREQGNPIRLTAQAIGNSLYGLQHMSNTHEEVRFALKELTELINIMPSKSNNYLLDFAIEEGSLTDFQKKEYHLASSTYSLSGQNIGNALWGLRNMTISSNPDDPINKELEELLEALSVKISESNYPMNGQNIGNAFYSLQGMSAENPAVRGVLRALAYKLVASNSTMSGLDIGMTLYGLKDMMHEPMIPEVRVIIGFLIYKIRSSDDEQLQFILRDITMSMSGILRAADWIRDDFFNVLSEKSPGFSVAGIVDRVSNCSDST